MSCVSMVFEFENLRESGLCSKREAELSSCLMEVKGRGAVGLKAEFLPGCGQIG